MNYTDNVSLTEVSESIPVFATNKTLHERFTQKQNRCVFIMNNGYTAHFRNNWLRNRLVIRNRKSLKISRRVSKCDSRKGNKATDVDYSSSYTQKKETCAISGNRRVVMFPREFEEDCSSVKNDIDLKNTDENNGSKELCEIKDNRRVILMSDGFKEDISTAENDVDMHTSGNDCVKEDLSAISDDRHLVLMPSESKDNCSATKNDIHTKDTSGSDCSKVESGEISDNRRVNFMPSESEEGCSVAKNIDKDAGENDGSKEELGAIIGDHRRTILMPCEFKKDRSMARNYIEMNDTGKTESKCLELVSERSQRAIIKPSFNYYRNGYSDCSDGSEPIIFKPYMLKLKNGCFRQSSSKRSSAKRFSSKQLSIKSFISSLRSSKKGKRERPSREDLDKEIDNYMAEIKLKKSQDSSDDTDSFVNEYRLETEKLLRQRGLLYLE